VKLIIRQFIRPLILIYDHHIVMENAERSDLRCYKILFEWFAHLLQNVTWNSILSKYLWTRQTFMCKVLCIFLKQYLLPLNSLCI